MSEGEARYKDVARARRVMEAPGGRGVDVVLEVGRERREREYRRGGSLAGEIVQWFSLARGAYEARSRGREDAWFMDSAGAIASQAVVEHVILSYSKALSGPEGTWAEGYSYIRKGLEPITFAQEDFRSANEESLLTAMREIDEWHRNRGRGDEALPQERTLARKYVGFYGAGTHGLLGRLEGRDYRRPLLDWCS